MIIRLADMETDREQILLGAHDFVSRMDFVEFMPPSREDFDSNLARVLDFDFIEVWVADDNGLIVAMIGMAYVPFLWNTSLTIADELFWWAAQDAPATAALQVIRAAQDSAKKKAKLCAFKTLTSSPEGVKKVYAKLGLREVETTFIGVL